MDRRAVGRLLAVLTAVVSIGSPGAAQAAFDDSTAAGASGRLWLRPLASLVVPGTGQLMAGQDRALIYLAAEAFLVTRALRQNSEAVSDATRYRDLAYEVARHEFTTTRRDTVFEYYETMEKFERSGEFDLDPGPVLAPESDAATYNGSVWLLARETYWSDPAVAPPPASPEYQLALEFYVDHAVGPDFRWSWESAALQQGEFRAAIRRSDDAYRSLQGTLGLMLANHLVSAVDALISSQLSTRLRRPAEWRTTWRGRGRAELRLTVAF